MAITAWFWRGVSTRETCSSSIALDSLIKECKIHNIRVAAMSGLREMTQITNRNSLIILQVWLDSLSALFFICRRGSQHTRPLIVWLQYLHWILNVRWTGSYSVLACSNWYTFAYTGFKPDKISIYLQRWFQSGSMRIMQMLAGHEACVAAIYMMQRALQVCGCGTIAEV